MSRLYTFDGQTEVCDQIRGMNDNEILLMLRPIEHAYLWMERRGAMGMSNAIERAHCRALYEMLARLDAVPTPPGGQEVPL